MFFRKLFAKILKEHAGPTTFFKSGRAGQTMIELVVAISVILIGVVSTLVLTITTIRGGTFSKMQVTAANLGREGIEVARMQRDNNWLEIESNVRPPSEWDNNLDPLPNDSNKAIVNFVPTDSIPWAINYVGYAATLPDCPLGDSYRIYFNKTSGVYAQYQSPPGGDWEPTPYYRLLYIKEMCLNQNNPQLECDEVQGYAKIGIQVHSQICWQEKDNWLELEFQDRLYNWKIYIWGE